MRKPGHVYCPLRLALTPNEAAQAFGCSRDFFDKHIEPELRWVRRGRYACFDIEGTRAAIRAHHAPAEVT